MPHQLFCSSSQGLVRARARRCWGARGWALVVATVPSRCFVPSSAASGVHACAGCHPNRCLLLPDMWFNLPLRLQDAHAGPSPE